MDSIKISHHTWTDPINESSVKATRYKEWFVTEVNVLGCIKILDILF